jgi:serine protease
MAPAARGAAGVSTRLASAASSDGGNGAIPTHEPHQIVVGYLPTKAPASATVQAGAATAASAASALPDRRPADPEAEPTTRLVRLGPGANLDSTLARIRRQKGVAWAVPNYVAHATGMLIPNDPGTGHTAGDWRDLQWNFDGHFGVKAPEAWSNASGAGRPAGSKVIVAVLDTGVAYANRGAYRRSPDFSKYTFVQGYDFISRTPYANDRNGHGTLVAGTIAEATNNHRGLTGLAYLARIMPVRVLDSAGEGDASVIAEGVRFAVNHGAKVINLSLEFSSRVSASDIPELIEALRYAYKRGVVVVAAAGNEGSTAIPYPARAAHVIAVGATTEHGCLASYSNYGRGVTLVAPGGGPDASLPGDPDCHPELPSGRDIFQMTFTGSSPRVFGFPGGYEGTSMATPHVAATAALIIAARVLGSKPSPFRITARLKSTARKLGGAQDRRLYGAGLLDAGAATTPLKAGIAK